MFLLILFILGVIGFAHIIVDAEIGEPLHTWAKQQSPLLERLLNCYQCVGFGCGLLLGAALWSEHVLGVFCLYAGLIGLAGLNHPHLLIGLAIFDSVFLLFNDPTSFAAGCAGSFLAEVGWLVLDSLEVYVKGRKT